MNWFHRSLHLVCLILAYPVVFVVCPLLAFALAAMCPPIGLPILLIVIMAYPALFFQERK